MTWFHFCTANHRPSGRDTLVDMAAWFEAGLLDSGHQVSFSHSTVEPEAVNVFWDFFPAGYDIVLIELGIIYGIVATELPDGVGFNWRSDGEWLERYENFHLVARNASFIWTMIESSVQFYSQFAPTAFMELGYSDRLIPYYTKDDPVNDFCFFGLRTPYREAAIAEISRYAKVEWPKELLSGEDVGRLIGRTKIGLSFKQSETWPIPSPTRLGRLMMAKRGVAAENVSVPTRQGDIVGLCPEGQPLADYALALLASDWRARASEIFKRYKYEMPMAEIMNAAVTLSGPLKGRQGTSKPIITRDELELEPEAAEMPTMLPMPRSRKWYHFFSG